MGRATVLDAFNAAAGFAGQGLGLWTAELKEKNELEARNHWALFNARLQNKIRDTPYDGDFDKYLRELTRFTDEEYGQAGQRNAREEYGVAGQQNGSPYYRKMLDQMYQESVLEVRRAAEAKRDGWRFEQGTVSLAKNLEAIRKAGWEAGVTKQAIDGLILEYEGEFELSPKAKEELLRGEYEALYTAHMGRELGKISETTLLETRLGEVNAEFRRILDDQGWGMGEEWEKAVIERETARIHSRNMEAILTDNAQYRRLMEEWARTGDGTLKLRAERIAKNYTEGNGVIARLMRGERDEITEYAGRDKDALPGLFMPYERRESGGSGGPSLRQASPRQVQNWLKSKDPYVDEYIRAYFNGRTTMENGRAVQAAIRESLLEQARRELGEYHGEEGAEQFEKENIDFFLTLEKRLTDIATKENTRAGIPRRMADFKTAIKNTIELDPLLGGMYSGRIEQLTGYFIDEYLDYLTSVKWDTVTEDELRAGTNEILGRLGSSSIKLLGDAAEKDPFAEQGRQDRERRLAEGLAAMANSPGIISTRRGHGRPFYLPGPNSMPGRYEEGLGRYMTESSRFIARDMLPNGTEAEIAERMAELRPAHQIDVKRDELNPAAVFQRGNSGVFYRARAEMDNRGRPTGKVIVEQQITSGRSLDGLMEDKWTRVENRGRRGDGRGANTGFGAARENEMERHVAEQRAREEEQFRVQRRMDAVTEILQNRQHPNYENIISRHLQSGAISAADAEKLRRGETP